MTDMVKTMGISKQAAIELVTDCAYDTGIECPTCKGEGTVPGGRKVLHTRRGGFGADNDVDALVKEIEAVEGDLTLISHEAFGRQLVVPQGDKTFAIDL